MFICSTHGKYSATNQSNECPWCVAARSKQDTNLIRAQFIAKAKKLHKNKYNYDRFEFVDFLTPGTIKCRKHGVFNISPAVHILHKMGCPKCSGSISKGETEWLDYLKVTERNNILIIGNKSVRPDGIDRKKKICYDYYGNYYHGDPKKYNPNDINKKVGKTFGKLYQETIKREKLIKSAGYKLITIWEDEWKKLKKKLKI